MSSRSSTFLAVCTLLSCALASPPDHHQQQASLDTAFVIGKPTTTAELNSALWIAAIGLGIAFQVYYKLNPRPDRPKQWDLM
ncbi:hypothetical protein DFJ77DRAFT_472814 [Powellomyces hirtus]|nr:hypothetical protein DFJ77DRAFT_472814 [Powellomyces hirtus]